jgi:THO complex subunit 2
MDISRIALIPALSLVGANSSAVNEVYELIQHFPFSTRFALYGEWQTVAYRTNPELKLKGSETDKDTKNILRRISKQDVKRFGRALAKKSTSNPLILWAIAINQIEYYDNFVEVVVDAARFCTNLGYDVLEFVILSSLSNPFKNRVKEDGTSIALWLTGLSAFCAKVFRRYSHMDVSTVTTYVACQLKVSNIYDLIVLRDLITQMSGVLVRENLSDHQLRCYAGGEVLKEQAMSLLRDAGMMVGLKKSSTRLLKALMDAKLVGLLFVLIAQERGKSLFDLKGELRSNLKLLGNLFDEVLFTLDDPNGKCHDVLLQYHDFLVSNLDIVSFEKLLPSFEEIVEDYGIEPSVAFYLWRPVLAHKVRQYDIDLSIQLQKKKLLQNLSSNERTNEASENSSPKSDSEVRKSSKEQSPTPEGPNMSLQNGDPDTAANAEYVYPFSGISTNCG